MTSELSVEKKRQSNFYSLAVRYPSTGGASLQNFLGKIANLAPLSNSGFGQVNTLKIGDFCMS